MKRMLKKVFTVLLAVCLSVNMVHTVSAENSMSQVLAPKDPIAEGAVNTVTKDKYATEWIDTVYSDVTLTVGGNSQMKGSDIVFVIDDSSSATDALTDAQSMFVEIANAYGNSDAGLKLGIITFNKSAMNILQLTGDSESGLVQLTSEEQITNLIERARDKIKEVDEDGTNIEAGLRFAETMLANDTTVDDANKYVILFSDGLTYMFNNVAGKTCSINCKYIGYGCLSVWYFVFKGVSDYQLPSNISWEDYWDEAKRLVEKDNNDETYNNICESSEDINASLFTEADIGIHASNVDRALYEAWEVYEDFKKLGYRCYAVDTSTEEYKNSFGAQFMNMLAGGEKMDFNDVKDSIMNSVSFGTKVVDYIGYEAADSSDPKKGYNFNFVDDAKYLTLKVGNNTYTTAKASTATAGATSTYTFTAPGANAPKFQLDYYMGNGTTEERFDWTFGENVIDLAPASLTYRVQLMDRKKVPGTYQGLYTNQSAILTPKDSYGNAGADEPFPRPYLEYTVNGINVSVTKNWDDEGNRDGIRPDSIQVQLYANGNESGSPVTLDASNGWKYTWENIQKTLDGAEIAYTVKEVSTPDKYAQTGITGDMTNGFTITNSYVPEKTSVSVKKVWSDTDNQDGIRPASVAVQLLANGKKQGEPVTLNADNSWQYTWTDLWKNQNGQAIAYTVEEVNVPAGYTPTVTGDAQSGYTITNNHTPERIAIDVTKEWCDTDNQDGIRPYSIQVQLYADGNAVEGSLVELNEDNSWKHTWTDLLKYEVGAVGQEITYTVEEVDSPEGYETAVSGDKTNGFTVINSHTPEVRDISVTKAWDDAYNQDGIRPKNVQVQLYANGEASGDPITLNDGNEWKHIWENLDKYAAGKEIIYTVEEVAVPEGYTIATDAATGDMKTGYTITNTHTPATTEVSVTKAWSDADNQDGIRPASVQVQLYANDVAVNGKQIELSKTNDWKHTWTALPKFAAGQEIKYTVKEVGTIAGYTAEVTGDASNGYTITNTHIPEVTEIKVTKAWEDEDDCYKHRPDEVQVQLYSQSDESAQPTAVDAPITLNDENSWQYTWQELPKFANGKEIIYTVDEVAVPQYYEKSVSGDASTGFIITNKLQKTSIVLTKHIDQMNEENATAIFRYLITGPNNYSANVTINFENGTVKVDGNVKATDTDIDSKIGFNKDGLSVTIENLDPGKYEVIEYAARGYQLVKQSDADATAPAASATAINGVQTPLTVEALVDNPGEAYFWNRYKAPSDYTVVNRFSVNENGNLAISKKSSK